MFRGPVAGKDQCALLSGTKRDDGRVRKKHPVLRHLVPVIGFLVLAGVIAAAGFSKGEALALTIGAIIVVVIGVFVVSSMHRRDAEEDFDRVPLRLTSGVEFLPSAAPNTVRHEEFRMDDPLDVGSSEAYCVHWQLLLPGDHVEAVGRIVLENNGTPKLMPNAGRLLLRVVRGAS